MSNYILLVFEGAKTEPQVHDSLTNFFLNENPRTVIRSIYGSHIYSLYHKLKNDPDLDVFALMAPKDAITGEKISREAVSEIYFFFDYDGHDPSATDEKISEMLKYFNNETEEGKLYISYPMVESLKHCGSGVDFQNLTVPISAGKGYKQLVSLVGGQGFRCLSALTWVSWKVLIELHLKKLNFLVVDSYEAPVNIFDQTTVFCSQKKKHIDPIKHVSVLSAFPVFLLDYYGVPRLNSKLLENRI